jgi:hypothetical protein
MNRWWWLVHSSAAAYRRAPDDELATEGRRLAARDREAGVDLGDWPREERERLQEDYKAWGQMMRAYTVARHPERLAAPPAWPVRLALIALATVLAALSDRWEVALAYPMWQALEPLESYARKRSAVRLALTPEAAPYPVFSPVFLPYLVVALATGFREPRPKWPLYLAGRLIGAVNERRSWRRAYRG